jgi:hypothetical protein
VSAKALLQHAALFAVLAAGIAVVLSAYGQDDVRAILRSSVRRFAVFVFGTAALAAGMAVLEATILAPG